MVYVLIPLKLYAYRTRFRFVKRVILEVTSFFDWVMVFAVVQNPAMLIHFRAYRGNFLFGKAVVVVDHEQASREIAQKTLRGNRFMGVELVTNSPSVFVTNAGPITSSQPIRKLHREYIDTQVMTESVRAFDFESLKTHCDELLSEWRDDEYMATFWSIRGAATRLYLRILTDKILPKNDVDSITFNYVRRFAEYSLFGRYFPTLNWLLGTHEGIREDVYLRLRRYDIDNVVIDMTLFAAMFSVGTIVMRCVDLCAEHQIDYANLDARQRMQFVIEAQRLHPTVTTVHRIVEEEETIRVCGLDLRLRPGDEVTYPFACINRDPSQFESAEEFRIHRTRDEVERVMSWSAGPHVCPAKDLSIHSIVMMLDTLAERYDLKRLKIFNPEF